MKSNLEKFAESVVASVYNVDVLSEENLGIDWPEALKMIELIATTIMQIINDCPEKKNLTNSLQKPSFLQRVRFRAAIAKTLDNSGQFKLRSMAGKIADHCLNLSSQATPDTVNNVILEVSDIDNMVI